MRETDLAREMLRTTEPLQVLKTQEPDRYFRLETFLNRNIHDAHELYAYGINKERKRQEIADSLAAEVSVVPPSRLLSLLQQALKYQQLQGILPKDRRYDLFRGGARTRSKDEAEKPPKKQVRHIPFPDLFLRIFWWMSEITTHDHTITYIHIHPLLQNTGGPNQVRLQNPPRMRALFARRSTSSHRLARRFCRSLGPGHLPT